MNFEQIAFFYRRIYINEIIAKLIDHYLLLLFGEKNKNQYEPTVIQEIGMRLNKVGNHLSKIN